MTGNLLMNGDARERTMYGWSVVNGGDGWSAKDGVFKTSFEPNTRRQVVSLLDWVEASVLDSGKVEIVLGEQITETGSRDKYFIRAALRNRSKIARVDEETSLLSTSDENPFDPHNGLEITKF